MTLHILQQETAQKNKERDNKESPTVQLPLIALGIPVPKATLTGQGRIYLGLVIASPERPVRVDSPENRIKRRKKNRKVNFIDSKS